MEPRTKTPPPASPAPSADDQPQSPPPLWQTRRFRVMVLLVGGAVLVGLLIKNQFPAWMGGWNMTSAQQNHWEGELDDALADCNRAVKWLPDDARIYKLRAVIQRERGKFKEALADCNKLLSLNKEYPQGRLLRSSIYQLLGDYDEAIKDAQWADQWWGSEMAEGLNDLAYARAVAGKELEAALAEANKALKLLDRDKNKEKSSKDAKVPTPTQVDRTYASYRDTRGFVYYRLGRHKEALADFDEAIKVFTSFRDAYLKQVKSKAPEQLQAEQERLNATLGLMVHHRALAYEKLEQPEKAKSEKERAKKLGYDPKKHGV